MATKKKNTFTIGLALIVTGIFTLLAILGIVSPFQMWWLPITLIAVGILVVLNSKNTVYFLGWLCMVYGAVLLLTTVGLFHIPILWKISSAYPILFGLILIL
jgi:hypothetical protein